ncbi:polyphosphate polymerase domain-containing protein [Teredinibacter haidensis]|uniref:polyphosphate polymerase domain-containing protein n=1 Tax=Teredinibacter haidensis TaxID=2731755 RepID=UPI000948EE64|nr:polyphosphate polymerase domain-containing protein [Teredinibacter haidensis]
MLEIKHNYRYERKFVVDQTGVNTLFTCLKRNAHGFRKAYPDRVINSIYFDDIFLSHCAENVDGIGDRTKVRVRWYGDDPGVVHNPKLELKIKRALVGRKEIYPVNGFDRNAKTSTIVQQLLGSDIPASVKCMLRRLSPVVQVSYRRKYYVSRDDRYRLTFDDGIRYYNAGNGYIRGFGKLDDRNIVELKYDVENDREVDRITNQLPFRLNKNSKYVNAIQSVYNLRV